MAENRITATRHISVWQWRNQSPNETRAAAQSKTMKILNRNWHLTNLVGLFINSKWQVSNYSNQWLIRGANPAMPPHRSWQWSLAPLGGRKSTDSIVNLPKSNDFGPPVSLSATDLAPLRKNTTLKH